MSQAMVADEQITNEQLDAAAAAFEQNIDHKAEVKIARLALLQALSPEIKNSIPGYKQGQMVNSVTREILSQSILPPWLLAKGIKEEELSVREILGVIPVMKLPSEFMKWIHRDDRKPTDVLPYEWKMLDGNDPRVLEGVWPKRGGKWGTDKENHYKPNGKMKPPPVTSNINYLFMALDATKKLGRGFVIGTFSRTSENAGAMLTSQVADNKLFGLRPWGRIFYLWSGEERNEKEDVYKIYQVAAGEPVAEFNKDLLKMVESMVVMLSGEKGRLLQEGLLNVADVSDEVAGAEKHGGDGEVSTGNSPAVEDPFVKGEQPAKAPF